MYTVLMPPGVNPIAVNKYISLTLPRYIGFMNAWRFTSARIRGEVGGYRRSIAFTSVERLFYLPTDCVVSMIMVTLTPN